MQNEAIEGQVLAGKYRVERVLGRGGMGVVVAAHHLQLDEKVAIKFLLPEAVENVEFVGRFAREARAAVRIKSEHVARVLDVGVLESGAPYIVMEYLEGSDLAGWVRDYGALPIEQAVEFVLQATEAIAEAHALNIVHRDLKPANLFVVRRADGLWSVKVLDFGISKVTQIGTSRTEASLTQTSAVMGSPVYMPPEQMAASKSVDARADIWALGTILYELIAGEPPFAGETLPEICMKIAMESPRPMRELRSDVSPVLEGVILRCLQKDRGRRYPNVAEFAHALVAFGPSRAQGSVDRITRTIKAAGLSTSSPSLTPAPDRDSALPISPLGHGTVTQWGHTASGQAQRKGRRTAVIGGLVLAALAGLALVLGVAMRSRSPAPGAEASSSAVPSGASAKIAVPSAPALASAPEASAPEAVVQVAEPLALSVAAPARKPALHKSQKSGAPPTPRTETASATALPLPIESPSPKTNIFDDR